jgi:hypothetical protein
MSTFHAISSAGAVSEVQATHPSDWQLRQELSSGIPPLNFSNPATPGDVAPRHSGEGKHSARLANFTAEVRKSRARARPYGDVLTSVHRVAHRAVGDVATGHVVPQCLPRVAVKGDYVSFTGGREHEPGLRRHHPNRKGLPYRLAYRSPPVRYCHHCGVHRPCAMDVAAPSTPLSCRSASTMQRSARRSLATRSNRIRLPPALQAHERHLQRPAI